MVADSKRGGWANGGPSGSGKKTMCKKNRGHDTPCPLGDNIFEVIVDQLFNLLRSSRLLHVSLNTEEAPDLAF